MTWNPEGYGLVALASPKLRKVPKPPKLRNPLGYNGGRGGIGALPGFTESLRLLLVEEEYTLEDVSQMFGVSRERIRQLAVKIGLPKPTTHGGLNCQRIWQDDEHRFRPVKKSIVKRVAAYNRTTTRKAEIAAKHAERWAEAVAELKDLARQLERTPTLAELSRRLGLERNAGFLQSYLFGYQPKGTKRTFAPLFTDAGLTMIARGHGRHRAHPRRTHCRRGHAMTPENTKTYTWGRKKVRVCRTCQNARGRERYHARNAVHA